MKSCNPWLQRINAPQAELHLSIEQCPKVDGMWGVYVHSVRAYASPCRPPSLSCGILDVCRTSPGLADHASIRISQKFPTFTKKIPLSEPPRVHLTRLCTHGCSAFCDELQVVESRPGSTEMVSCTFFNRASMWKTLSTRTMLASRS